MEVFLNQFYIKMLYKISKTYQKTYKYLKYRITNKIFYEKSY